MDSRVLFRRLAGVALVVIAPLVAAVPAEAAWWKPAPSLNCGSTTYYKPNGAKYSCSFVDHFDGTALNGNRWVAQTTELSGHSMAGDCWVNDPDNIAVKDGSLRLTTRQESAPFTCKSPFGDFTTSYTSGSVSTRGKFAQTYGRYEYRVAFPNVGASGIHGAVWLYPQTENYGRWPASGEIDVAEWYSARPDYAIPTVHYNEDAANTSPMTNYYCKIVDPWNFHTYVLEWTSTSITVSYDGQVCMQHKIDAASPLRGAQPFDKPFVMYLTQALGGGKNAFIADSTRLPQTMLVDSVRVWK